MLKPLLILLSLLYSFSSWASLKLKPNDGNGKTFSLVIKAKVKPSSNKPENIKSPKAQSKLNFAKVM